MAQPPPLKSEKNYTIGTSLLHTRWAYGNDHAHHVHFCMLTGHQSIWAPAGRLALANKAYTSIRPDGVVIDRSVG